jgi:hypothetical protein
MKRIRIVGLCLTAVFAFSAVAVTTASAHEYIVGGVVVGTAAEVTGVGTAGPAELRSEIGSTKIVIICKKTSFTGEIEKEGKSKATIKYELCELEEEATGKILTACTVEPPTAKVNDLLEGGPPVKDKFEESGGLPFTEITITGASCALKVSKVAVKGSQVCELPGGEVEAEKHKIVCSPSGSSLKFGTKTATYTGTVVVELKSHKNWRGK